MDRPESVALVAVCVHLPEAFLAGDPDAVPSATVAASAAVVAALQSANARIEQGSLQMILAAFPSLDLAIPAAFAAVAAGRAIALGHVGSSAHPVAPHVGAGIGFGPAVQAGNLGLAGPEVSRAWRLATVAAPGEVLCTEPARAAWTPAVGVGVFRSPPPRLLAAGFGSFALVDYR